jgi:hypothetical protein
MEVRFPHGSLYNALALLDSGADHTILPAEGLAAAPGMDWPSIASPIEKGTGAGGGFATKLVKGEVWWQTWKVCEEFRVAEPGSLPWWGLLGRDDFFRVFVVRFMWHRNPPEIDIDPAAAPGAGGGRKRR